MRQFISSCAPDWPEVIISWATMLNSTTHNAREILAWVNDMPGDRYHLHGWLCTEGFAFRFENSADAIFFALRWGNESPGIQTNR